MLDNAASWVQSVQIQLTIPIIWTSMLGGVFQYCQFKGSMASLMQA